MEQLLIDLVGQSDVETIRNALTKEINNLEYTKFLVVEKNKDETISIRAKNILIAKIKFGKLVRYILVRTKNIEYFKNYIATHEIQAATEEDQISGETREWTRIPINNINDVLSLVDPLCIVYMLVLSELGGENYGCCSRYIQCSDEKKCLNPDFFSSLACSYKRNLESGRIFYGKNKNC